MYETFYGMSERPFALTPDPAFLFMSSKHSLAMSMLEYTLMGQAGFTVVTGEIGSGKTTLIRQFLKNVDRSINLGVVSNTHQTFGDLLQWILAAFGIESSGSDKANRYQVFAEYLIEQYGLGHQTILIIDEAQNLSIEVLEELRLLSNINADKDQLLQMILVGQPELLDNLRRPELKQFAQRISIHYHLSPLSGGETQAYIRHRLKVAGARPGLFDEEATRAVYHFSNGVPRLINSICDMALVYGYALARPEIDFDIIRAVVSDREKGSLLALPNRSAELTREKLAEIPDFEDVAELEEQAEASAEHLNGHRHAKMPEAPVPQEIPEAPTPAPRATPRVVASQPEADVVRAAQSAMYPPAQPRFGAPAKYGFERFEGTVTPAYLDPPAHSTKTARRPRTFSRWFRWLV
jgi:type II secretory pathway predicted ATPase ExeA